MCLETCRFLKCIMFYYCSVQGNGNWHLYNRLLCFIHICVNASICPSQDLILFWALHSPCACPCSPLCITHNAPEPSVEKLQVPDVQSAPESLDGEMERGGQVEGTERKGAGNQDEPWDVEIQVWLEQLGLYAEQMTGDALTQPVTQTETRTQLHAHSGMASCIDRIEEVMEKHT